MRLALAVAALAAGLVLAFPIQAGETPEYSVETNIIVSSGVASPDGNGVFADEISPPLINNAGQIAFWSKLLATTNPDPIDDYGLYRGDSSSLQILARGGDTSAAGNQLRLDVLRFASIGRKALFGIDRQGQVPFVADDDDNMDAIYLADGTTLQTVIQEGETTPFGANLQLGPAVLGFLINNEGEMAYQVSVTGSTVLLRSDAAGNNVIFDLNQSLPGGNTLLGFRTFALNDLGQVVARLNTGSDSFGYFISDGQTTTSILQTGEPAPDGLGSFVPNALYPTDINNSGAVPVILSVDDISTDYVGLFQYSGSTLSELNRTGQPTFEGTRNAYASPPTINENGSIAYSMVSDNTNVPRLILRRSGEEILVLSEGDAVPSSGTLAVRNFTGWSLNDQDQLLISANVFKPATPLATGIFFYDPDFGLATVAEVGQSFNNGIITILGTALPLSPLETNNLNNAQTGFNDAGQVAFSYTLDNGEVGIATAVVNFVRPDALFSDSFEMQ